MTARTGVRHEPHPDDPIRCVNCEGPTIPDDCRGMWLTWRPVGGGAQQKTWISYATQTEEN